jgi:hypothetical protein
MDRFDNFLVKYLPDYINNLLIDEIIITDENGNDVDKIHINFPNNNKLVLIKNDTKLGPFLNKQKACSYAKNEWIALMDSDNFASDNYFITAKNYIDTVIGDQKNIILAPSKAQPNFNYSHLCGFIYKKDWFDKNNALEKQLKLPINSPSSTLMNTGNYIINKHLINNLNLSNESNNINLSSSCDVIYINTLLFEQLDLNLHVVTNLEYDHVVHNGSIYIQTSSKFKDFAKDIHQRYYNLK